MGTISDAKRQDVGPTCARKNVVGQKIVALMAISAIIAVPSAARGDYLYVSVGGGIAQVDPSGNVTHVLTYNNQPSDAYGITSIATDGIGDLFQVENPFVVRIGGGNIAAGVVNFFPKFITADALGDVYVYDSNSTAVQRAGPGFGVTAQYVNANAQAMAADVAGTLYTIRGGTSSLDAIHVDGTATTIASDLSFGYIIDEALGRDAAGNLYLLGAQGATNNSKYSILQIAPGGSVRSLAGPFSSSLMQSAAVAVDSAGNIFFGQTTLAPDGDWLATLGQVSNGSVIPVAQVDIGANSSGYLTAPPLYLAASPIVVDVPEPQFGPIAFGVCALLMARRRSANLLL